MAEERKYRIRVDGVLVEVSREVYRAYYSIERHTRTLDEKDTRNGTTKSLTRWPNKVCATINILPSGINTWSNGSWRTSGIWGWMAIPG